MKINQKQLIAVMGLSGTKRFEYFIKVIVDWREVWGLYQDGWALAGAEDGAAVFPFWSAKEYAQACAENEWAGYCSRAIDLDEFLEIVLSKLKMDGILPGVFYTPSAKGVTPTVGELIASINDELLNY